MPSITRVRCIARTASGERCKRFPAEVYDIRDVRLMRLCGPHRSKARAGEIVPLMPPTERGAR